MKRCPVGAITEAGHDKALCSQFVLAQAPRIKQEYGIEIYACGLCQTGVPCEKGIPRFSGSQESDLRFTASR